MMTNQPPPTPTPPDASDSWKDVGQQFQVLGQSLAAAMRAAWQNEEARRRMQDVQNGVESMVNEVGQAFKDAANTPQGQQLRQEASKAADNVQNAVEQTAQEVRPHLVSALQQVNRELQRIADQLNKP
jgi:hypothetical protein